MIEPQPDWCGRRSSIIIEYLCAACSLIVRSCIHGTKLHCLSSQHKRYTTYVLPSCISSSNYDLVTLHHCMHTCILNSTCSIAMLLIGSKYLKALFLRRSIADIRSIEFIKYVFFTVCLLPRHWFCCWFCEPSTLIFPLRCLHSPTFSFETGDTQLTPCPVHLFLKTSSCLCASALINALDSDLIPLLFPLTASPFFVSYLLHWPLLFYCCSCLLTSSVGR